MWYNCLTDDEYNSFSCCYQVVNNSLNPIWNQTFDFVVEDGLHDLLMLEVWDHDTFGKVTFSISFFCLSHSFFFGWVCVWLVCFFVHRTLCKN